MIELSWPHEAKRFDRCCIDTLDNFRFSLYGLILSLPKAKHPNDLPEDSGIYFVWRNKPNNELLYIGKAVDLKRRWKNHGLRNRVVSGECEIHYKNWRTELFKDFDTEEVFFICALAPELNDYIKLRYVGSRIHRTSMPVEM